MLPEEASLDINMQFGDLASGIIQQAILMLLLEGWGILTWAK